MDDVSVSGLEDVAPDAIDEGGIFNPAKYQTFTSLVRRATQWITRSTVSTREEK